MSLQSAGRWCDRRLGIGQTILPIIHHPVPKTVNWWYVFGSATLVAFIVQVITGVALAIAYVPAPDNAYETLQFITDQALLGRVVRGVHYWGASAMVVLIFIHMCRTFLMGSYKFPRELNWLSGVLLFGATLGWGSRASYCGGTRTCTGRLAWPPTWPAECPYSEAPVVSISNAQRRSLPNANWMATVPNGIPLRHYTFNPRPGTYLAFLGRISPDKGVDTAIHIALRAGLPIRIAAREPLSFSGNAEERRDWDYFEQVVRPLFREPGVEFLGQVGGHDKDGFLGEAAALLFPIRWPEPFGLVMAEALACGTPVLALDCGSVPEVIRDGHTGFIRHTEDQLVEAVQQIPTLDRACCRAKAERRFSARAMADGYEAVYARLRLGTRWCMPAQPTYGRVVP